MKAKSKSEIAAAAGVSIDTLRKWMQPFQKELEAMGLKPGNRVLPPRIVKFLADKLCIDIGD
jgi:transposase